MGYTGRGNPSRVMVVAVAGSDAVHLHIGNNCGMDRAEVVDSTSSDD